MHYIIQAQIVHKKTDGESKSETMIQIPTFFIDDGVTWVANVDDAKKAAEFILNPTEDPNIEVHANVGKWDHIKGFGIP